MIFFYIVRVGGGYLSLAEFVDKYLPLELEKMERRDPVNIFAKNIAINKTI